MSERQSADDVRADLFTVNKESAAQSAEYVAQPRLTIVPLSLRAANAFVAELHRHHKPARGHKFSVGAHDGEKIVGVAIAGRPVSRHYDDGRTLEVNRTCTDGSDNANSCLYGAAWRVAKNMGYRCAITYTQEGESGVSLRAAGWRILRQLPARGSWAESSVKLKGLRDEVGNGGVARTLWGVGDTAHIDG